ncbi:uncharacterized protein LOC62_03G004331 [Vanrija pseudolonga]|uniref:Nuclear pore complex protein Nup85 n=1 Tax=Vanrija pseudolonga TaxID=143232 RepID=A0AAF1BHU5_9TREE|nr:hypothetical protein LOC62_03G004331 [Vanrija pseudolonga]
MLSNVAGDCLARLLKTSSVNDDSDLDGLRDDGQRSFEGLRGVLQQYIYSTEPPAYTDVDELMKSLDPFTRTTVARGDMDRAIWLTNLATFVWTITYPDLAASLADAEEAQGDKGKGKAKAIALLSPEDKIRRRNGVLIDAWKKFWLAMGDTSVDAALSLWLDLATLIVLTYRLPTIDPFTAPNTALASPPEDLLQQLFSADALQEFGHLPVDYDARQRWQAAAEERREEVRVKWARVALTTAACI